MRGGRRGKGEERGGRGVSKNNLVLPAMTSPSFSSRFLLYKKDGRAIIISPVELHTYCYRKGDGERGRRRKEKRIIK
jgi:hypothetical protein